MYDSHFVFIIRESSVKENRCINFVTVAVTKALKTRFTDIFNRIEIGQKLKLKLLFTFHSRA